MVTPHPDQLVPVTLDKPRSLYFNLKALRALDRAMGEVGIGKVLELIRALNFQALERVLWAGLLHDEPRLTVVEVAKRLDVFEAAGGDSTELFRAAYRGVNDSGIFGGREATEGNATPEQAS